MLPSARKKEYSFSPIPLRDPDRSMIIIGYFVATYSFSNTPRVTVSSQEKRLVMRSTFTPMELISVPSGRTIGTY